MEFSATKHWIVTAVALVLILFLIVVYLWLNSDGEDESEEVAEPDPKSESSIAQVDPAPQFPPRKLRRAWLEPSGTGPDGIDPPQNVSQDSTYVMLTGDYDQWLIGTPVEVVIPQTKKRYRSIVDRIAPDDFGNITIHTNPDVGEDEFLHLIMTLDNSHTFAYVSTTAGSYEFVGSKQGGWITPSSSLHQNIDYSEVDVLKTRRDRHVNTKYVSRREE